MCGGQRGRLSVFSSSRVAVQGTKHRRRSKAETFPLPCQQARRCAWGRLIVPNHSIGRTRLREPRRSVENAFGPGKLRRGWASYFGGHLLVDYVYKVRTTK